MVKHLSWDAVNVQFHHVFPTRVILWLSFPVLRVDDATYKHANKHFSIVGTTH